ncbi:MAG: winged helix-turn-helix transcriptional regulator [Euryarchaeota archaeon]|nr:winged helix-turn-helix transcriptional regulator [Euryarchaeota archaeon]
MSKGRIRSNYQRRALNWLLDGGCTVSEAAEALNLQMPHASLALRQLRERGDVTREDQTGIRGAKHFITDQGRQRLEQDALSRLKNATFDGSSEADGVLLGHDGQHVLLGYVKPLTSELIHLPLTGVHDPMSLSGNSNGNMGGCWAVARTRSTQWYDLGTFQPIEAPQPMEFGTLSDWSLQAPSICVVHARLIDSTSQWNIAPGSWFITPENNGHQELMLEYGHHTLGHSLGNRVAIRPPMSLHGHTTSKVGRKLALEAMSENALVFEHHRQSEGDRTLPLEALWYWLRSKHPRLSGKKLEMKFQEICRYLVEPHSPEPSISLQRALLSHFGKANWTLGEVLTRINLAGTTPEGAASLLDWYLTDTDRECVVEWMHQVEPNRGILERLLSSQRCRLLLTVHGEPIHLAHTSASLKSTGTLGVVQLKLGRGQNVAVQLLESKEEVRSNTAHERIPSTAAEMVQARSSSGYDPSQFSTLAPSLELRRDVWHALSMFPEGDEKWANLNEFSSPVASWIATPNEERTSRWIRLRNRLPDGWADLLPIQSCDTSTLLRAMPVASEAWTREALDKVRQRFSHNTQSMLKYEEYLENDSLRSWMSAAVLLTSQHLSEEFQPMVERACEQWLTNPCHPTVVLEALFPLGTTLSEMNQSCMLKCLNRGQKLPKTSVLYAWSTAVMAIEHNQSRTPENLRNLMSVLPPNWWTVWAAEWLLVQLSSSSGRRWLRDFDIPWPALLARPSGERSGLPGLPMKHPARMLAVEDVLQIHLVEDGSGKPALLDVHDMLATLHRDEPVHYGRLHPLVGWLSRPVEDWPTIGIDALQSGNEEIGALLYARSFAHRLD